MRKFTTTIVIFAAIGLVGCSRSNSERAAYASLDSLPSQPQSKPPGSASSSQSNALATLATEAGRIEQVSNQPYADGLHQKVRYDRKAPGLKANEIDLKLRINTTATTIEPLAMKKPSEAAIRAELASQFPKMQMRIVDQPHKNAYGVYGIAIGKWDNGVRCIYAWQWIDNPNTPELSAVAASLRMRFCRTDMSLDQLASLADSFRLTSPQDQEALPVTSAKEIKIAHRPLRRSRNLIQTAAAPVATRAELKSPVTPESERPPGNFQGTALDASLPAAAYRGPVAGAAGQMYSR